MLNSFWNLCRICPSMPTEKLNSEYKTHFKWHGESYHLPIQEAIKKSSDAPITCEPAICRKKKRPELAYRTHQMLRMIKGGAVDSDSRARLMTQSYPPAGHLPVAEVPVIPKTTEYGCRFAWPLCSYEATQRYDDQNESAMPRKSVSMGAIQAAKQLPVAAADSGDVHEGERLKSPANEEMTRSLEEQIFLHKEDFGADDANIPSSISRPKKFKTEYKSRFKQPSKYIYVDGNWKKTKETQFQPVEPPRQAEEIAISWYAEVLELRKKAGEYKVRSWASAMAPDHLTQMYNRQKEVWDQVSRRSSLSALALAATPSESAKQRNAQKEKADGKLKSVPVPVVLQASTSSEPKANQQRPRPASTRFIPHAPKPEVDIGRGRVLTRHHHLERTTPSSDGALLTSPTRDHKLEPAHIQMDRESKTCPPTKTRPSPKSSPGLASGRSASVGPEGRTQKYTPRTTSASVSRAHDSHADDRHVTAKRPRPTSLATSASRPKSGAKLQTSTDGDNLPKLHTAARGKSAGPSRAAHTAHVKESTQKMEPEMEKGTEKDTEKLMSQAGTDKEVIVNGVHSDLFNDLPSPEDLPLHLADSIPVVKSPPEPTRVKSPEQIIVKSPEPVKWTVPLETGIKWTGALQTDGLNGDYVLHEDD